ncbi:MAG: rod shape-determining protein MreC [Alphaproteobacteria bacterium]|nr:rod shape-determining protein MreC [Alphaproteobacteria bacterium]
MAGGTRFRRVAVPLKALLQRFAYVFLASAAVALMVVGQVRGTWVETLRTSVTDLVAPVQNVVARPAAATAQMVDHVQGLFRLYQENELLRQENDRLLAWQAVARRLDGENQALRTLLAVAADAHTSFVSTRVIADPGGAFVRTLLVNAGERDGVAKGQAAVNHEGLVGRVIEAGQRSARVLLITDLNSRIPVVLESTRDHAILVGDNTDRLKLLYLPANVVPAPGERIVTSGQGGMIPPGIPIGRVTGRADGQPVVEPFVRWNRVEFVSLLNHGPAGGREPGGSLR